jgi:hypothetical protein
MPASAEPARRNTPHIRSVSSASTVFVSINPISQPPCTVPEMTNFLFKTLIDHRQPTALPPISHLQPE